MTDKGQACCSLTNGMKHYEVWSPRHEIHPVSMYENPEPPGYGNCWRVFEAESASKAKGQAVQSADFSSWTQQVDNPFKGLEVRLFICPHGLCIECMSGCCPHCDDETKMAFQEI